MIGINCNGIFDDVGMIESVIVLLNDIQVKGVENMKIIFDCIARLDALKKSLKAREGEKDGADTNNGQGQNV